MVFYGCESFLDKAPDLGLSEEDIFKDYASLRGFFDESYTYLENFMCREKHGNLRSFVGLFADEMATLDNNANVLTLHSGNWLLTSRTNTYEIGVTGMTSINCSYRALRIINRVINDHEKVPGLAESEKNELLGQAYFLRAWFYFQLIKRYGGMPIIDKVFVGDGDENIPRVSYHESHDWMMEDIERAIAMLPDAWDNQNTGRPNKVAALAFKSMAQLYDASPLMQNGLDELQVKGYDTERAKLAARSATEVLRYIDRNIAGVDCYLMPTSEYQSIFYWTDPPKRQPEHIWYNRDVTNTLYTGVMQRQTIRTFFLYSSLAEGVGVDGASFCAPSQNMVDLFEKRGADGNYYPISDSRAGYDLQELFEDRDPRFYNNIIVPGEQWGHNNGVPMYITTYEGGAAAEEIKTLVNSSKRQQTSYLCRKYIWPSANQYEDEFTLYRFMSVYIRVAQIYLDLAEASFEATGSATARVDGCDLTAEEALNVVRRRAGITDLPQDIVTSPEKFREAYRRERAVELMFENHRWWDIRRWMIAHELFRETNPIKGLRATPKDPNHNSVADKSTLEFTFEVIDVVPESRSFQMRNYWYPFPQVDAKSVTNLQQNPGW